MFFEKAFLAFYKFCSSFSSLSWFSLRLPVIISCTLSSTLFSMSGGMPFGYSPFPFHSLGSAFFSGFCSFCSSVLFSSSAVFFVVFSVFVVSFVSSITSFIASFFFFFTFFFFFFFYFFFFFFFFYAIALEISLLIYGTSRHTVLVASIRMFAKNK
ncbi:hypothetical protein DRJ22_02980, partial [Candidatus Woesearchaeota archaeon]